MSRSWGILSGVMGREFAVQVQLENTELTQYRASRRAGVKRLESRISLYKKIIKKLKKKQKDPETINIFLQDVENMRAAIKSIQKEESEIDKKIVVLEDVILDEKEGVDKLLEKTDSKLLVGGERDA